MLRVRKYVTIRTDHPQHVGGRWMDTVSQTVVNIDNLFSQLDVIFGEESGCRDSSVVHIWH